MQNEPARQKNIMISYCHRDKQWLDRLRVHLKPLESEFKIEIWDDTRIRAGSEWHADITAAMQSAKVAVLLVSADFLASDFIRQQELPFLLESNGQAEKDILPIIISPCGYVDTKELSHLQPLNPPEETLVDMALPRQERFLDSVQKEIRRRLQEKISYPNVLEARLQEEHSMERRYNVVVIGKTGVGKSTLLNYLFGRTEFRAGVGKPVTSRGFHKKPFESFGIPMMFFDSWGLELDKHKDWISDLEQELKERGTDKPVEQWFHTILFCVGAGTHRIEDFELEIIKRFIQNNYKVTVVFTKSDMVSDEELTALSKVITDAFSDRVACIPVCSEEKVLRSGVKSETFGAQAIRNEIFHGFWESLTSRLPERCVSLLETIVDEWCKEKVTYVNENAGLFNIIAMQKTVRSETDHFIKALSGDHGITNQTIQGEFQRTLEAFNEFAQVIRFSSTARDYRIGDVQANPHNKIDMANWKSQLLVTSGPGAILAVGNLFSPALVAMIPALIIIAKHHFKGEMIKFLENVSNQVKERVRALHPEIERSLNQAIKNLNPQS